MAHLNRDGWLNFLLFFSSGMILNSGGFCDPDFLSNFVILFFTVIISYLGAVACVDLAV